MSSGIHNMYKQEKMVRESALFLLNAFTVYPMIF